MIINRAVMSPFWLSCWSCVLALGWLLPNHYRPWLSFHSDMWIALALLIAGATVCIRLPGPVSFSKLEAVIALLIGMVWVQHVCGLIPLTGNAWISSIYLFGLFTAIVTGSRWERAQPRQLVDGLFFAIGIAAILSVGIQLHQWFRLDGLALWIMGGGHERAYANFGQANQLATFLIWGLLSIVWGCTRGVITPPSAIIISMYLMFGIALTGSRTAWIGILLLVFSSWFWQRLWQWKKLHWVVSILACYFFVCVWFVRWIQGGEGPVRNDVELRPIAWKMFLDAISRHPWGGYGWNQTTLAQIEVAIDHPYISGVFSYAHNLFLDLVLWCGIPIGICLILFLLRWFWRQFTFVNSAENALLFLFLLVIANHAMLELPLYFAYFLLPVGMVIGVFNARSEGSSLFSLGRWSFVLIIVVALFLATILIRDYARVESSYGITRLEWSGIKVKPVDPPDVLMLSQWNDFLKYAKFEPRVGLSASELMWMNNVGNFFPSAIFFYKLAMAQALNQKPQEAERSLRRMCKMVPPNDRLAVRNVWNKKAQKNKLISVVPWPDEVCK